MSIDAYNSEIAKQASLENQLAEHQRIVRNLRKALADSRLATAEMYRNVPEVREAVQAKMREEDKAAAVERRAKALDEREKGRGNG